MLGKLGAVLAGSRVNYNNTFLLCPVPENLSPLIIGVKTLYKLYFLGSEEAFLSNSIYVKCLLITFQPDAA